MANQNTNNQNAKKPPASTCNCPILWTSGPGGVCNPLIPGLPQLACNTKQNPVAEATAGAAQASIPGLSGMIDAFQTLTSPGTWVRVGLFAFALMLVIIGFLILSSESGAVGATGQVVTRGVGAGAKAAFSSGKKRARARKKK